MTGTIYVPEWMNRSFIRREDHPQILKQLAAPQSCVFEGKSMRRIGIENKFGLQGYGAYLSNDGTLFFEGFFMDNCLEGPHRQIKLSTKRPGNATIREGFFKAG